MTDLLLWSLFWPFIIIVPLALMALFKYFNPRSFEILMYFLHRLKSEQSARQYWEDLQYLKNQKENESTNPSQTENPWTPELSQWGPGKCSGFYKLIFNGDKLMDKFQVLTWNVFNRFILRNEKVAYQVNPGEVLILDHAHDHCSGCKNCGTSRHWSDRRRENYLVFDSNFKRNFSFIIWMRQDGRDTDPTFLFIRRRNG